MSVRVLIVDAHAVVRSGLRLLLDAEEDVEVVGEAASARDAAFAVRSLLPDVAVLDVSLPQRAGLETVADLVREHAALKVVVLSAWAGPKSVREAFARGASGYVLTEAVGRELVDAVREVARGGRYIHPALGARLVVAAAAARRQLEEDPLSAREREVLRLLALGHTNQEIAGQLYISVRTAETHRARIMQKLRLTTRAELVRHALAHGLLSP
jgi:DNA-binding NarL/FixJ family response regulator